MLNRYLKKQSLFLNPSVKGKKELFRFLSEKAFSRGQINDVDAMIHGLEAKEAEGIMELKPHIVLPHARGAFVKELFMNLVVIPKGLDYKGAMKGLAKIIVMVGIPEADQQYLRLLAMISRLIINDNLVEELLYANVTDDLLFTIKKFGVQVREEVHENPKKYVIWLVLNHDCEEERISTLLAEVGVALGVEMEGKNLGDASVFLPFLGSFGFGSGRNHQAHIFTGLTDEPKAAAQLFNLLKQEGIDLSQDGVGSLYQLETMNAYGGNREDLNF